MELTLLEACLAKNQLARRHGFSPIQHVLGQDIRLPASILNGDGELAAHSRAVGEGNFQRRLAIREAARMAWVRMDNSSKLRKAMVARVRPVRGLWLPGLQVYFWKRAGRSKTQGLRGRARQEPERWIGPAIVLSQEGQRAVWLSYRGLLYKVSPEHVREATAE